MDSLAIRGGRPLRGTVDVRGAKNAALPAFAAALLSDRPLRLRNIPEVADVAAMRGLLTAYGVAFAEEAGGVALDASGARPADAGYETVRRMRAAVLVLGPLLARFGQARVSMPGGCAIGARPVDLHVRAMEALGATVSLAAGFIEARAPAGGLAGGRVAFPVSSVGATEAALLAATLARGETEILNAAREPEVVDLARCLAAMGARIEGAGSHRLLVQGPTDFRAATHEIVADRVEAGTYAIAAAITGGQLELVGARLEHLAAMGEALEAAGVALWPTDRGLMVSRPGPLRSVDVVTQPYPGFSTDLQAQFTALMSVADGTSLIRETVFENRFMHVPELARLGANIALRGTTAAVRGVAALRGAPVMATDLRASVCLVLAGLAAEGETVVSRVYHLDRGYEALDRKLARCGADVRRVPG